MKVSGVNTTMIQIDFSGILIWILTKRDRRKKSISPNGQAIKVLPPPSSLMAIGTCFLVLKKVIFSLMARFLPLSPLNGLAITEGPFLRIP